jgi:hypothetical protein
LIPSAGNRKDRIIPGGVTVLKRPSGATEIELQRYNAARGPTLPFEDVRIRVGRGNCESGKRRQSSNARDNRASKNQVEKRAEKAHPG